MSRGVIYMAWGKKAAKEAAGSIQSLWTKAPEMQVKVVGDADCLEIPKIVGESENLEVVFFELDPFRGAEFLAGRVKPLLYNCTPLFNGKPWDRTLYVDADTRFRASPEAGFALLDRWDFLVAETGQRTIMQHMVGVREAHYTRAMFGEAQQLLYHNSGMLFWRRNKRVERLFELWSEEWLRFEGWDEQMPLLRAIARSDTLVLTLPYTWNTNFPSQAAMVFHEFGKRVAWKHGSRRGPVMTADQLILEARHFQRKAERRGLRRKVKVKTGADLMTEAVGRKRRRPPPPKTGADLQLQRKPKRAPRNKAVSEEEVHDKEVAG